MVIATSQHMDMAFPLPETTAESMHLRFSPYSMSHLSYTIFRIMYSVDLALFVLVLQTIDSEIATHLNAECLTPSMPNTSNIRLLANSRFLQILKYSHSVHKKCSHLKCSCVLLTQRGYPAQIGCSHEEKKSSHNYFHMSNRWPL